MHYAIVLLLQGAGFEVYDFKHPLTFNKTCNTVDDVGGHVGFKWRDIDAKWEYWSPDVFQDILKDPRVDGAYTVNKDALDVCDKLLLVLPCGASSHLELGYAIGQGKETFILMTEGSRAELMYKMVDHICTSPFELLGALGVKD